MNRIRELRLQNGWRQEDLADRLNTKYQTVGHYETGRRGLDVETILKLCEIFGCSADYLLGRSTVRSLNFSEDELALVNTYRSLSAEGKEYLRHTLALATLAHSEKSGPVSELETAE